MEDLTAQDSQLMSVASTEGIDVTRKSALAQEEVALEIATLLGGSGAPSRRYGCRRGPASATWW